MKKQILGMTLVMLSLNSIANVRYGTYDCQDFNYKLARTFDNDDKKFKSRYMYTAMIIYKKVQPRNRHSDYFPVYHDSTPALTTGVYGCPKGQRPCMFTKDWEARARTSIWEEMNDYLPNRIDGFHYWRRPGNAKVEFRQSKAMSCWRHNGIDWDTGESYKW